MTGTKLANVTWTQVNETRTIFHEWNVCLHGKIRHTSLVLTDCIVKSESEPSSKRDIKSHSMDEAYLTSLSQSCPSAVESPSWSKSISLREKSAVIIDAYEYLLNNMLLEPATFVFCMQLFWALHRGFYWTVRTHVVSAWRAHLELASKVQWPGWPSEATQ